MEKLYTFLEKLIYTPTLSGYEKMSSQRVLDMCLEFAEGFFNYSKITKTGSVVLCRKCGKKDAKRLCFDAHLDTIGFAVSKIGKEGYLRFTNLGGVDINILPSSSVLVLGKETVQGVISSIPPHLANGNGLPDISELMIDTGLSEERSESLFDIGTPIMFYPHFTRLLNDRVSSVNLDDKVCIAAVLEAVGRIDTSKIADTDIYVYLSTGEERGGVGSHHIYEEINPDALIVLDVNFAKEKGSIEGEYGLLGEGAMISLSSVTSRKFTKFIIDNKAEEKLQIVNEMTYTGTNADVEAKTGVGLVSAVVSIPIKYMHSFVEMCDMKDVIACANILSKVAEEYNKSDISCPVYYKGGKDNVL